MEMYPESDTPEFGEIDDDAADEALGAEPLDVEALVAGGRPDR